MQVHDELVLEVREDATDKVAAGVREQMAGAAELKVPLRIHIGAVSYTHLDVYKRQARRYLPVRQHLPTVIYA